MRTKRILGAGRFDWSTVRLEALALLDRMLRCASRLPARTKGAKAPSAVAAFKNSFLFKPFAPLHRRGPLRHG